MDKSLFSKSALDKIRDILSDEEEGVCFRVQIEGGGCKGLRYVFSLDSQQEYDFVHDFDDVIVLIDDISYPYLESANIDYVADIDGEKFVVNNPQEKTKCSCGSSFQLQE